MDFSRLEDEDEILEDARAEVAASIDWLRTALRPLEGHLPPEAVDKTLAFCHERLSAAQRELREFEVELEGAAYRSGIPGYTVRSKTSAYQAAFQEQSLALAKLRGTLEFFAAQRAREQLLGAEDDQPIDRLTPSEIIDQASAVQGQSQASVTRSARLVQEARQVGAATVGQLGEQRDRMQQVSLTVSSFVETLGQAEREAKKYASGIFDDTAQLVCVAIILLGLTFVGLIQLSEVEWEADSEEPHHLQTALVTVNDLDLDRGPWHWGDSHTHRRWAGEHQHHG